MAVLGLMVVFLFFLQFRVLLGIGKNNESLNGESEGIIGKQKNFIANEQNITVSGLHGSGEKGPIKSK